MGFMETALNTIWAVRMLGSSEGTVAFPGSLSTALAYSAAAPHPQYKCLRLLVRFSNTRGKPVLFPLGGLHEFAFAFPLKVAHWQLLLALQSETH